MKTRSRKARSPAPAPPALGPEGLERRASVNGRVHVAEVPLVSRHLAVRMQIALVQHQLDLILGEIDVDQRQRATMEGKIPGGEPRIFPGVRH